MKVSNIELSSGFWEEVAGGPLPVSSQRDRRWIADGSPHCRAALGKHIRRNKSCGDWRNRKNVSYVPGKYKLLNIITAVKQKCFSGSRLERASKWKERLLYSGKAVAGNYPLFEISLPSVLSFQKYF